MSTHIGPGKTHTQEMIKTTVNLQRTPPAQSQSIKTEKG